MSCNCVRTDGDCSKCYSGLPFINIEDTLGQWYNELETVDKEIITMPTSEDIYIVTSIDREGDREIRKSTEDKEEAISYFRTVEERLNPELWKKIDTKKGEK